MKKSTKSLYLLFILILITAIFLTATIARYVTTTSNQSETRIVAWGINAGNITMNLFANEYELEDDTIIAKSRNGDNIIAPGLNGASKFNIVTANASINPEVMYEIIIDVNDSEIHQMILDNPSIQWKLDNNPWGTWEKTKFDILALSGDVTGRKIYAPGTVASEFANGKEHSIAWRWLADNNNDEMDTLMGNMALTNDISALISINITAIQTTSVEMEMLDGNFTTYNTNNPEPVIFRADGNISEFTSVELNNEIVANSNYTVENGSIKVTLKESFLNTLDDGDYIITINAGNKKSNGIFTVKTIEENISPILSENSWETISRVASSGKATNYWSVGDKTTVDVDGTDYEVVIIGMNHDGANTITFAFNEYVSASSSRMNDPINKTEGTNAGGWENSKMRKVTMPEILNKMENKDYIIEVEKKTMKGYSDGGSYVAAKELVTTRDKLFLLSYTEAADEPLAASDDYNEGTLYEYYANLQNRLLAGSEGGDENRWWLRTPDEGSTDKFYMMFSNLHGSLSSARNSEGIVPAFVVGG